MSKITLWDEVPKSIWNSGQEGVPLVSLAAQERERDLLKFAGPTAPATFKKVCAWCGAGQAQVNPGDLVTHGICGACAALMEGESYMRDEAIFRMRTQERLVVVAASQKKDNPDLVVCHACLGGRGNNGRYPHEPRVFLVPAAEYETRGRFGFIIDPARHPELRHADARAA